MLATICYLNIWKNS